VCIGICLLSANEFETAEALNTVTQGTIIIIIIFDERYGGSSALMDLIVVLAFLLPYTRFSFPMLLYPGLKLFYS
jgi:hypothetical protein